MSVTVRLLKEGPFEVAQCLEYDVAAQGESPAEALASFTKVFMGEQALGLKRLRPAPDIYWTGPGRFVTVRI